MQLDQSSSSVQILVDEQIYNSYRPQSSFMKTEFTPYDGSEAASHIHYMNFTRPHNLLLPQPSLEIAYSDINNLIRLQANNFIKNIYLYLSDYSESLKLSDNYFDMIPGEVKYIKLLKG